ncbi:MAG: hypothetical protein HOY69_37425 [Streptomyces sp.]|nr:hypothetical protein [Streptomyces sp.]
MLEEASPTSPVLVLEEVATVEADRACVARLLAGLRELSLTELPATPGIESIFDDLERVLGESAAVAQADVPPLAQRLHVVFRRLMGLSRVPSSGVTRSTADATAGLLTELMPPDLRGARGYLRRLALAVSDLLDELLEDMP